MDRCMSTSCLIQTKSQKSILVDIQDKLTLSLVSWVLIMSKHLTEAEKSKKYLHHKVSPLLSSIQVNKANNVNAPKMRRRDFILDGVREQTSNFSVLTSYNAFNDRHAQSYFRQPAVQDMLKRAAQIGHGELLSSSMQSFKLSKRQRAPGTPGVKELIKKESKFVIDCVKTDSLKSKRNPIIPQYDALNDGHAKNYFRKRSVRSLLRQTCDVKY